MVNLLDGLRSNELDHPLTQKAIEHIKVSIKSMRWLTIFPHSPVHCHCGPCYTTGLMLSAGQNAGLMTYRAVSPARWARASIILGL